LTKQSPVSMYLNCMYWL